MNAAILLGWRHLEPDFEREVEPWYQVPAQTIKSKITQEVIRIFQFGAGSTKKW